MLTVKQLRPELAATHPEWPAFVCWVAARFYLGIETRETLATYCPQHASQVIADR